MSLREDPAVVEAARLLLQHLAKEESASPQSPLLRELWVVYWDTEAKHLRSSIRSRQAWKAICHEAGQGVAALEDWQALSITSEVVEKVRSALRSRVNQHGKCNSPATVNRHLIVLRRLLNWAVETKRIPYNPIGTLRMEPENNVRQTVIRTEEDFQRLLSACDPWNRALALVYFDGGLRRMEGFNLRRDQLRRKPDGGASVTLGLGAHPTKSGHPRNVRLTRRAVEALDALPARGQYFFARPDGLATYSVRYLYRRFREAAERCGIKPAPGETLTYHALRHSFAYVRRAVDHWPESRIMSAGGWRTHAAFDRYGIVDETEMDEAVAEVEQRISVGKPLLRVVE